MNGLSNHGKGMEMNKQNNNEIQNLDEILASPDFIITVEVRLKRGKARSFNFRSSNYPSPKGGWAASDFLQMAFSQCDRWLALGGPLGPRITHAHVCNGESA